MKGRLPSIPKSLAASLLALSLVSCTGEPHKTEPAPEAVPVTVGRVQHVQERERIAVSGTVSAPNAPIAVSFLVSGRVELVGPREGEYVKKGQVLARIDPTDFDLAVKTAAAQMASAQAAMEKALHSVRPESLEQARIAFERAEDEHRRMKMLYDSKSLAPNDYEKFRAAFESARQQYEQAKAGGQKEDKDLATAAYNQAAAQLEVVRKALSDATLSAPANGHIAKRLIEPGATASAGHPVFEIVQIDPVEVNVGVPETDVYHVRLGQKVEVTVPALPGRSFEGTVRVVNVSADPNTRTYMARITVPNPQHVLRIGMVAEARILGTETKSMMTLPGEAVVRDPQGATQVFVYYPDQSRVYAKRVEIGVLIHRDVEIRSGLSGTELVVLAGQTRLRDGLVVAATEQPADRHSSRLAERN
ncbi:MAG: efflux RND transporter periplasmic adaptor subunit [Thermodesulfobacteriota bacterium]